MFKRKSQLILASILLLLVSSGVVVTDKLKQQEVKTSQATSQGVLSASNKTVTGETAIITKVVDGDTITVEMNNVQHKIRIIGINTPESVDPRRSVQCFGVDASNTAKEKLTGQTVLLEKDASQSDQDKYGRLLRFVWFDNGKSDFGAWMIANGYAYEYTYDTPHKYQAHYKSLQQQAETQQRGLWSSETCKGEIQQSTPSRMMLQKKKCSDFTTRQDAQNYFDANGGTGGNEVKQMDGNGDGEACETLP